MAKKILSEHRSSPVLYTLLGISCHSRDYNISFHLNEKLELGFTKMDDYREFSFFFCRDDNDFNSYFLLGNRGQESVLFPELKQTDYIFLVEGPLKKAQKDNLIKVIRSIQSVLTAFEISFDTIKNYHAILNDLELHFLKITMESKIAYSPSKKQEVLSCSKI
ncbi:MAG: IPExxxVDY family protein [Bacteroidota bacterium]